MKNNITTLLLLPVILLFAACNKDFFDQVPDDILTIEEVFNRKDLSEEWLAGVYNQIRDEAHRTNSTPWDVLSDDADVSQRNHPFRVNLGNWSAASDATYYWNFWEHYYKAIRTATTFINNIDGNEQILEEREGQALITQRKAEARFLRAFFYFELLKQYGPVIILGDEEIAPDLPLSDPLMQQPRSPFDVCVDYIVNELDLAAQDLPVHYINQQDMVADFGRASQIMCKAIKSRLLLYAASPLYNGNSDYAGFTNPDGTPLFNMTYDASKWQRAAAAAKEVIDYAESSGQLGLYKVFSGGEIDAFLSYRDVFLDSWNIEWIMARNTNGLCSYQRSCTPRLASGYASMGPTQQLVDTYRMADGSTPITGYNSDGSPVINTTSGYTEDGFSSYQAPGSTRAVNTYNMYINREPRFYATVTYSGSDWINTTSGLGAREIQLYWTGESGKGGSHDYSETGYLFRKNVSPTYDPRQTCTARTYVMMRYAEILLNYVETLNEYSPGHADILEYLNQIRERGGLPALASVNDQTTIREEIRKERRIELTMEHLRYFDTRRWKIAERTDSGPFYGMNVDAGTSNTDMTFFQRTAFENRVFRRSFYLFPIPQGEIERNPNCVQNPGW